MEIFKILLVFSKFEMIKQNAKKVEKIILIIST